MTQSWRDPSSTIKPFLYNEAFAQGATPEDTVDSGPIHPGELSFGVSSYSPRNVGDYDGPMSLRTALEKSINTVAVRVGDKVGIDRFIGFLNSLGIGRKRELPRSPTAFLGAFGVRPIDWAAAYTVFPNGGPQCAPPHIVGQVHNYAGAIVYSTPIVQRQGSDRQAASLTADCLRGVIEHGTAKSAASLGLKELAMGKTGTTNSVKDAWFAGSTNFFHFRGLGGL